jgi:hypothetical protein
VALSDGCGDFYDELPVNHAREHYGPDVQKPVSDANLMERAFGDAKLPPVIEGALCPLRNLRGPMVTTNFHHILERAFRQAGCGFEQIVWGGNVLA